MRAGPSFRVAIVLLSALVLPGAVAKAQVAAGPTTCNDADLTPAAIACSGSWDGKNDIGANVGRSIDQIYAAFLGTTGSGTWSYIGSTDAGSTSGPFSTVGNSTSGTLALDNPVTGLFVIALKSSTNFSFYLFDANDPGISSLEFTTIGASVNKNGKAQALSHASLFEFTPDVPVTTTPEPGTFLLAFSGVAGLFGIVRRRRTA